MSSQHLMKKESELKIEFSTENQCIVRFKGQHSNIINFKNTQIDLDGKQLFKSIFTDHTAFQLFRKFKKQETSQRILIINAYHSKVLSLAWERLYDPQTTYVCYDTTIRRSLVHHSLKAKVAFRPASDPFFGRSREIWQIEKAFIQDKRRMFTIIGVGGQGKTYLAREAAHWLSRTGLFKDTCYIDYARFFGIDAVGFAIRAISKHLKKDLDNITDVYKALQEESLLLLFDNMETVPDLARQELLKTTQQLSEYAHILLTSDTPDNSEYNLTLSGLDKEEAIGYFKHLLKLPPAQQIERETLITLFKKVHYHPLSIKMLAVSLSNQNSLETLEQRFTTPLSDNPLIEAIMLMLEGFTVKYKKTGLLFWLPQKEVSLTLETLQLLPVFGVFQSGGFVPDLLSQTKFTKKQWYVLRIALEHAGLMKIETFKNFRVPYITFHPSFAPMLWHCLSSDKQKKLFSNYQFRYAQMAGYMFIEEGDSTIEVHQVVRRDMPNLLHAVYGALEEKRGGADKFANNVDLFLNLFLYKRDSVALKERIKKFKG